LDRSALHSPLLAVISFELELDVHVSSVHGSDSEIPNTTLMRPSNACGPYVWFMLQCPGFKQRSRVNDHGFVAVLLSNGLNQSRNFIEDIYSILRVIIKST